MISRVMETVERQRKMGSERRICTDNYVFIFIQLVFDENYGQMEQKTNVFLL